MCYRYGMTRPATSVERLAEEYRALRDAAAVVDLTDWTVLALTGPDAREFLQGTATQEFESLPAPGTASRTLFLTEKGRPVALAWVLAGPDPKSAILIADPGARSSLKPHLERFRVMEDVEIQVPDDAVRLFGVAGPERDPLAQAIAAKIEGAQAIRSEPLSFLLAPAQTPPSLLPPAVDPHAFEAWRIRSGIPYQGIDLDQDRIATELILPEAISMTKGCYVGQEVVARTANRGKLRRQRIGFRFAWGGEPIPRGTEVRSGGQEAGIVTSTAWEPGTGEGLGMGYAMPDALARGLDLLAIQGEKSTHLSPRSWPL
ncbi:MAG TPA: glycine cleavage T C-terminal barrel domain-containing protein [Candidatus Dormibacteraeota bacterium]|nr:glycine cleavage T C-terminal barrel domain-containing protein [Candidatus Dormibacteraeota bacterium]